MLKNLPSILESGERADLKIECEGTLWTVHSVILSAQSAYFKKACNSGVKVSITGYIILCEADSEAKKPRVA